MARWDHADLHSLETKAVLYPEYCDADVLRRYNPEALRRRKMAIGSDDFGFSAVSAEDLRTPAQVTQATERVAALKKIILPLLDNLLKDPKSEYLHWPDRARKVAEFRKKIVDFS